MVEIHKASWISCREKQDIDLDSSGILLGYILHDLVYGRSRRYHQTRLTFGINDQLEHEQDSKLSIYDMLTRLYEAEERCLPCVSKLRHSSLRDKWHRPGALQNHDLFVGPGVMSTCNENKVYGLRTGPVLSHIAVSISSTSHSLVRKSINQSRQRAGMPSRRL